MWTALVLCPIYILGVQFLTWLSDCRPYDVNTYEDEIEEDDIMDEEGRTRLKLKV